MTKKRLILAICAIVLLFAVSGRALGGKNPASLPYYLPENASRYESYITANPNIPFETAVAYVNAGADKVNYGDIQIVDDPGSLLVLCTKNYALPIDYVPENLVSIGGSFLLRSDAAESFLNMKNDAKKSGLNFVVYSAYRSGSKQKSIYNSYVSRGGSTPVDSYSARPGHSEHQAGLAIDILHKSGFSSLGNGNFQNTKEYDWLMKNAYKYGFILRYPKGYTDITGYTFEPWHWRYIGKEAALTMHKNNIATYEEYFGKFLASDYAARFYETPITSVITFGGAKYSAEAYLIDGIEYYRLRDIAYLFSSSDARFDIIWNGNDRTIGLIPGAEYTAVGVELAELSPARLIESDVKIFYGETPLEIDVYETGGNCFVSLEDFVSALNLT